MRVLWVCHIALVSVVAGLVILGLTPQAQDLFLETPGFIDPGGHVNWFGDADYNNIVESLFFTSVFCVLLLVLWAIPLHGAARWSLDGLADPPQSLLGRKTKHLIKRRPPFNRRVVEWTPRILGLVTFAAVEFGIWNASYGLLDERFASGARHARHQLYILAVLMILGAIVFYVYTRSRFNIFNYFSNLLGTKHVIKVQHLKTARAIQGSGVGLLQLIAGSCVFVVSALLICFIIDPQLVNFKWRALLVPIVLGTWVPFLSFVSWLSYPLRMPVLGLIIAIITLYQTRDEGHTIRPLASTQNQPANFQQLALDKAVELWRGANLCGEHGPNQGRCPRPIIVAAAGGASRAAYFVASTLGLFMDLSCDPAGQQMLDGNKDKKQVLPCNTAGTPAFANQLFAISGVSGGSLGAAVFSSVLKAHQEAGNPAGAPCQDRPSRFWFHAGQPLGWRDCMQEIISEDFLSPAIIGLAFRDLLPFLGFSDRAALLEDLWIEAFRKFVPDKSSASGGAPLQGMAAAFDSFAPNSSTAWRPLLILNGTSVATGDRILTSHLAFASAPKPVFSDAYDFRDIFKLGATSTGAVSLATAVTNSARFPLISPQGVLRNKEGDTLDRVVDGGYFENYGITTAQEIAKAITDLKLGLDPLILLITNDPLTTQDVKRFTSGQPSPPVPEIRGLWFSWISSPFLALYQTRSSRGDLAAIRTDQFPEFSSKPPIHIHITVYGEPMDKECSSFTIKPISMSWWLSKPVQEYLDGQFFNKNFFCGKQNTQLLEICESLRDDIKGRCKSNLEYFDN